MQRPNRSQVFLLIVPIVAAPLLVILIMPLLARSAADPPAGKPAGCVTEDIAGSDIKRISCTEQAARRLDIQTVAAREEPFARTRIIGADLVVAPTGRATVRPRFTAGELTEIDRSQPARVQALGRGSGRSPEDEILVAMPLPASPTAIEQLYTLDPPHSLTTGQRVLIEVPLLGSGQRTVIPYSAVFYDVKGGAWAYISPERLKFMRHRLDVDHIAGDKAYLRQGPPPGTNVVTAGVAQILGVETGVGK